MSIENFSVEELHSLFGHPLIVELVLSWLLLREDKSSI